MIEQCEQLRDHFAPLLPLTFDGELVFLLDEQQSDFARVQQRGRLKNKEAIKLQAERFPCHLIAFDLLRCKGKSLIDLPLMERKTQLQQVFKAAKLPPSVQLEHPSLLQLIYTDTNSEHMKKLMTTYLAEGLVAKKGRVNGTTILGQKNGSKSKTGDMLLSL